MPLVKVLFDGPYAKYILKANSNVLVRSTFVSYLTVPCTPPSQVSRACFLCYEVHENLAAPLAKEDVTAYQDKVNEFVSALREIAMPSTPSLCRCRDYDHPKTPTSAWRGGGWGGSKARHRQRKLKRNDVT
jgi:hypothetical protein